MSNDETAAWPWRPAARVDGAGGRAGLPAEFLRSHSPTLPPEGPRKTGVRCTGYRRNSSEEGTEKSQPRQTTNIETHITRAGLIRVLDDFVDEGVTGTSTHERHGFMAMMDAVVHGQLDVIVVEDIDRFSRNFADTLKFFDLMQRHGVALHDVKHGPLSLAHVTILGFMASEGRGRLLGMLTDGKRKAVEAGLQMGAAIYGYRKHPSARGERVLVPERAEVVRRIFRMVADGVGLRAVARSLTAEGLPPPSQCARQDALEEVPRRSMSWSRTEVRHLVANPYYMGTVVWGRVATVVDHETKKILRRERRAFEDLVTGESRAPAIVDETLWCAANASKGSRAFGSGSEHSRIQVYLLTPVTTCGVCGSRMHVVQVNNLPSYVCSDSRSTAVDRCSAVHTLRAEWLEAHVLRAIRDEAFSPEAEARFRGRHAASLRAATAGRDRALADVEREIVDLDRLLDASTMQSITAGASDARVERIRRDMEGRLVQLAARRLELRREVDPSVGLAELETLARAMDALIAAAPNKVVSPDEVKLATALRRLVRSVVVGPPDADGRRTLVVEIDRTAVVGEVPDEARVVQRLSVVVDGKAEKRREAVERAAAHDRSVAEASAGVADLDDDAWAALDPVVRGVPPIKGFSPRELIDCMFLFIKTGATLKRPPERCGDPENFRKAAWSLIYHRTWDAVVAALREARPGHLDGADLRRFDSTSWQRKSEPRPRVRSRADRGPDPAQAAELEALMAASTDEDERRRYGIMAAFLRGRTAREISEATGSHLNHVYQVRARHERGGAAALRATPRPTELLVARTLSPEQEAEVEAIARTGVDPGRRAADGSPARLRNDDLIRLCGERYGAKFSRMGMLQLLRRRGVRLSDAARPGEAA